MSRANSNLRTGKRYRLVNHGETWDFEILELLSGGDCALKDLHTLEKYRFSELTRYGRGKDYSLVELDEGKRLVDRMFD